MTEAELKALNAQHRIMIAGLLATDVDDGDNTNRQYIEAWYGWPPREIIGWNKRAFCELSFLEPIWDWICETFPIPDDLDSELDALNAWQETLLDTPLCDMPFSLQTALVTHFGWDKEKEEYEPPEPMGYGSGDSGLKFSTIRRGRVW